MSDVDAAHILFPSDTPQAAQTPEWFKVQQAGAEVRLSGGGHPKPDPAPDVAAKAFPSETRREPASIEGKDAASAIFKDDATPDYEKLVSGELDYNRMAAIQDGDTERAEALQAATSSLSDNFKTAGTPAEELREAFDIVRQSAGLAPPTPEEREASFAKGMEAVQSEGITDDELSAARRFIADLDKVSPGVKASLEAHGAGNSPRLIRAAVNEAKRRGYR